jgi:hypothetical protein
LRWAGFLYAAEAVVMAPKRRGRDFLRLSQNRDIWGRVTNILATHDGWTLSMLYDLLDKLHREKLELD